LVCIQVTKILIKAWARDIAVKDMKSKCNFTDYFVIATAHDEQHIDRLGSAVLFKVNRPVSINFILQCGVISLKRR